VNTRREVHAYLLPEDYRRLRLEASARGVSLSRCAGDCLAEYFGLRQEMATAFEAPHQAETLAPPRVIHILLAQTEQRLVATMERYGEDLTAVRAELAAVLAMLDRSQLTYLCYTPEVPPAARDQAQASGQRRFTHWRQAVGRMLDASGRPVPWPLVDPEGVGGRPPSGAHRAVPGSPEVDLPPPPPPGGA
jgi:hypothetical protein